ncbi:hypothetical protein K458DRAFT_425444 [Lentithecium fluviatile CBS 122367]|uniref:Uncharacterized protein n=1 Tax=Lentithecium fluviatile CBS 122367 TaxID=1168545 RepID=A0A6G1JMZ4_9PLEO|nr:hypothetical protein K458DRAFT_425444 [Lentithecium fluviatile CBS 122367]
MDSRTLLRQLLRTPHAYRTMMTTSLRPQTRAFALLSPQLSHPRHLTVPRLLQPSFWASMIPQPLKGRPQKPSRESNPATPFIVLGLLVGSQAIQMLWLKQERARDLRRAEAKIGILKEVIERVQAGEEVDVEKVLGSGDEVEEGEWAAVLKDIEEEELLFQSKKVRKALRQAAKEQEAQEKSSGGDQSATGEGAVKVEVVNGAKFY